MKRIGVAGCKHTTLDFIKGIINAGFKVDCVITISEQKGQSQKVAGFYNMVPFLKELNIPYYIADKYSLLSDKDEKAIKLLKLDLLFCVGWQRLIPEWFLNDLTIGAFGMHGSNKPLPHGRGRSPLNWSLIQNKKVFFTHLFRYKAGVDDGDIVGYQLFEITPFDTALTLHYKNLISMIKIVVSTLPSLLNGSIKLIPQPDIEPSFYPKREEEDGLIHWDLASEDIYNLIRAVTAPFPGAFGYINSGLNVVKIKIWKAIPFDTHLRWDNLNPGTICMFFFDSTFIVKTGDTSVLVQEYEVDANIKLKEGLRIHTNGKLKKTWENLPN